MSEQTFLINFGFNDIPAPELIYHVFRNDLEKTEQLLEAGSDLSQVDGVGHSAVWWASNNQSIEMLKLLANYKSLEALTQEEYNSFLGQAANRDNMAVYNFWRAVGPELYQASKNPALRSAVSGASIGILKDLLKNGADPNYQDKSDGTTALHLACEQLRVEMAQVLLHASANPTLLSKYGHSAADYAAKKHLLSPFKWHKSEKTGRDQILKILEVATSSIVNAT